MKKTRNIEIYTGYHDNTWDSYYVEIPADTPENDIEKVAIGIEENNLNQKGVIVAFIGLYSIPSIDGDDDY